MVLTRRSGAARSALGALALGVLVAGCGGAIPPREAASAGQPVCDPARLGPCERAIAAALAEGRPPRAAVTSYLAAREARDAADPWARLLRELSAPAARGQRAAVIVEGGGGPRARAIAGAAWAEVGALPRPEAIDPAALLLAIGEAAGMEHLFHVRGGDALQLFPRDPLAPFTAGVPPIARGDAALARAADDIALASRLRRAFAAAAASRYIEAAREADALAAAVAGRDPHAEPVLRGRYALQLLAAAGISLDPPDAAQAPPPPDPPPAPPAPADTPYGDYLRIRTAKDGQAAWAARGRAVLQAVAPHRREALESLLGRATGCGPGVAPPMEDARDLVFAARLSGALAPIAPPGGAAAAAPPGALPFKAWLARYESLVRAVDHAGTVWAHAPSVLYQRGDALGMSLAGTPTYRRVTELGLAHLRGLQELAAAEPVRFRALAQIPLVYSPGLLSDDPLRDAIVELTQATVQRKVAAASDAEGVFSGVLAGVLAGMSYPAAVQPAHYLALQGAFTAKLRGDLTGRTGWGVAGLYAADGAYRVLADQAPNLPFSSAQIARALRPDPATPYPGLAALATSLARYAVLGVERKLDPEATRGASRADPARLPPERREARDALQAAIAGLADGPAGAADGAPPQGLLEDITILADGLIAVLATDLAARSAARAAAPPPPTPAARAAGQPADPVCAADADPTTPATRRALARLGDVRRRILLSPRYKAGDGAWIRRARLLVTLLSDGMDAALSSKAPIRFTIPSADAAAALSAALRDWDERELADALAGGYAMGRGLLEAPSGKRFVQQNGKNLRRILGGLHAFFRKDAGKESPSVGRDPASAGPSVGVALLDALATMPPGDDAGDLGALLVGYAKAFSARGLRDQGDLWLLSSLVAGALSDGAPPAEAVAQATESKSRVAWALRYLAEIARAKQGVAPDPAAYAEGMRAAQDDACATPDVGAVLSVMGAVRDFSAGRRTEARAALDRVLEDADARGLSVPRMTYKYEEKTSTRVFALTFDISYGAGLLEGPNTFQVGLGLRTPGVPEGALSVSASSDPARAGEEAARYYVHAAALAAAYHFLEGDGERGAAAVRRAISALSFGVRLGPRTVTSAQPVAWGKDARALLALDAQLAAEAGMPFLAGDLWTLVRALLGQDEDDAAVARLFDPLPVGLAAVPDVKPLVARAARSVAVVAAPLPCTDAQVELGGYEEPACDAYPLALSLRITDVLKKLPRLRRGGAGQCATLQRVDAFLGAADRGTYDPDAFTGAVEALRADGRPYDAAVLLTRQRRDGHCNPALVAASRALGRSAALGPELRSDALTVAVNCGSAALSASVVDDLVAIDGETRLLPDLSRNLRLVLFVTDLALREKRYDVLTRLTAQPDFIDRWMKVSPQAATAALLIDEAAAALAPPGGARPAAARGAYELFCETFPPGDRAETCGQIKALRAAHAAPPEERRRRAKEALEKLVSQGSGPP